LCEKTLHYAPSASFLVWCRTRAGHLTKKDWPKDICLFGDALYGETKGSKRALILPELERLPRLTATRDEAMSIAEDRIGEDEAKLFLSFRKIQRSAHLSGAHFDLYLGSEASRRNLLRDLSSYRILHLAVHGLFDQQFSWYSGLVLSGANDDEERVLNL